MTALNAYVDIQQNAFVLSMDTLVSTENNGKIIPCFFTTKFLPLPSSKTVLCGTGSFNFLVKVMEELRFFIARNVDDVVYNIKEKIIEIYSNMDLIDGDTSTIYFFGLDYNGKIRVYALRSVNNFEIEDITGDGYLIKPSILKEEELDNIIDNEQDVNKILTNIMKLQKSKDDVSSDRLGIGGFNMICQFLDNQLTIKNVYEFPDYKKQYDFCLNNNFE